MKKLLIIALVLLAGVVACKKDSDNSIPVTQSNFMFFNGVKGFRVNVRLDSTIEFANGVAFGEATPYRQYRAQMYNIMLINADRQVDTIRAGQINLRNNRYYSAYLAYDTAMKAFFLGLTEDDLSPVPDKQAKVRVINLSQTAKFNGSPLSYDLYSDTFPVFRGVPYKALTGFTTLNAEDTTYKFRFVRTDSTKIELQQYSFKPQAGRVYTLVTTGSAKDAAAWKVFPLSHN
ncbi:DUF4397 domain-containing protein [Chitinophaga sp. Mgbs1]|uniref:DUF4397 domain-containing protein n=1 Tax=Chitinophaga solisilvae TaxID=1233460 RepID=A0A3S1AZ58_9BACT|nr:DUF4397 domain-containing protein [Chitinophaga solisilvae]